MKKSTKIVLSVVLALSVIIGCFTGGAVLRNKQKKVAEASDDSYFVRSDGSIKIPRADLKADGNPCDVGTEGHPFFVLEIVPYDREGFFGYQIDGCQPVDIDKLGFCGKALADNNNFHIQKTVAMGYWEGQEGYEDYPKTKLKDDGTEDGSLEIELPYIGEMTKTPGTGNYSYDGSKFVKNVDNKGNYTFEPMSVVDTYKLRAETPGYTIPDTYLKEKPDEDDKFKFNFGVGECKAYYNSSAYKYTHKNTFLKYAYGLAYEYDENGKRYTLADDDPKLIKKLEEFKSIVYTVTPEDLNMNIGLIDRADMIVISTTNSYCSAVYPEYIYKQELFSHADTAMAKPNLNKKDATFVTNPIDWPVAQHIFERVMNSEKNCPIIVDSKTAASVSASDTLSSQQYKAKFIDCEKTLTLNGTENNMYKLLLMLLQMKSSTFKQLFKDSNGEVLLGNNFGSTAADTSIKLRNGNNLTTGVFKKDQSDAVTKWNLGLFYPYNLVYSSEMMNGDALDSDKTKAVCYPLEICTSLGDEYNWNDSKLQDAVRGNVYTFNGDKKMREDFYAKDIPAKVKATSDDQYGSTVYDFLENVTKSTRPNAVDVADIIYYILHYKSEYNPNAPLHCDLKILDLEPSVKYQDAAILKRKLEVAFGDILDFDGNIEIVQHSTAEFIGKRVEYLSEYDLVYFGTTLPKADNNVTEAYRIIMPTYADKQYYAYAHSGSIIDIDISGGNKGLAGYLQGKFSGAGFNSDTEKFFIYSGNDITKLVYEKLSEYKNVYGVNGSYPIIFGDGFFTFDTTTGKANAVAPCIDRNSWVYELIPKNRSNALSENLITDGRPANYEAWNTQRTHLSEVVRKVVGSRVRLENVVKPLEYEGMTNLTATDGSNYLAGNELEIKFTVNDPLTRKFDVKFYVDSNGDGSFAESECIGARIYNSTVSGLKSTELLGDKRVQGGKTYYVDRRVKGRVGSVNWKLDLVNDGKVYASVDGFSVIKAASSTEVEVLKILQIVTDSTQGFDKQTIWLPTDADVRAKFSLTQESGADTSQSSNGVTQKFIDGIYKKSGDTYVSKINGLFLKFERMTGEEILEKAAPEGKNKDTVDTNDVYEFLCQYKMLVPGFADCYKISRNANYTKVISDAIIKYASEGRAVLYTHDASSFVGENSSTHPTINWGKEMTLSVRSDFGMDRYSVLKKDGDTIYYGDKTKTDGRADLPYMPSSSTRDLKLYLNSENGQTGSYMLAQGYANGNLFRITQFGNNMDSKYIDMINKGAITSYPYKIADHIQTAVTHPQYYQLDMENPNINVWYTLSGNNDSDYKYYYGTTKKDVRNNYYIYNIDNITYTGVGHNGNLTDAEVMLFINTFVAAYRASAAPVNTVVVNDDAVEKNEGYFLCIDVDSSDAGTIIGNDVYDSYTTSKTTDADATENIEKYELDQTVDKVSKRVYFYINDESSFSASNVKYSLSFKVNDSEMPLAVYKAGSNKEAERCEANLIKDSSSLERNTYYFVDVPMTPDQKDLTSSKSSYKLTKLTITTKARYTINGKGQDPKTTETIVNIMPRGLFNLD